ncbi:MAG: hypothetical protein MUE73_05320 [Planctomycetes bacterium]|nr:hypothetical protein [Planctomycetota bacterium]
MVRADPPFDLVFCDPPHRYFEDAATRSRLGDLLGGLPLSAGATVVVEHRARALGDFRPPGLALDDLREWGTVAMAFYRPSPAGTP